MVTAPVRYPGPTECGAEERVLVDFEDDIDGCATGGHVILHFRVGEDKLARTDPFVVDIRRSIY